MAKYRVNSPGITWKWQKISLEIHKNTQLPPKIGVGWTIKTSKQAKQPIFPSNSLRITKIPLSTGKNYLTMSQICLEFHKSAQLPPRTSFGWGILTWKQAKQPIFPSNHPVIAKNPLWAGKKSSNSPWNAYRWPILTWISSKIPKFNLKPTWNILHWPGNVLNSQYSPQNAIDGPKKADESPEMSKIGYI